MGNVKGRDGDDEEFVLITIFANKDLLFHVQFAG